MKTGLNTLQFYLDNLKSWHKSGIVKLKVLD